MVWKISALGMIGLLVAGCGDDTGGTASGSAGSSESGADTGTAGSMTAGSMTAGSMTAGSMTAGSETAGTGDSVDGSSAGETAGSSAGSATEAGSGSGSAGSTGGDGSTGAATDGTTGGVVTGGESSDGGADDGGGCQGPDGEPEFSYIWIANSDQGTISKIDTVTMVEEGRYIVRPDSLGSPSRTSVSLGGDVAVANREGGVTKVYARLSDCPDAANTAVDENFLPWMDGCIAWYTPMVYASQRPVAWAPGDWDPGTCSWSNEKLWTSGANATIDVHLLDGETGVIEQTIPIPGVEAGFYGIYGAASDGDGNFWGSQLGIGHLVRVDRITFAVEIWPMPTSGYGMTVDENGRAWTCSSQVSRFDYPTETWQSNLNAGGSGGCMIDGKGAIWLASNSLVALDIETMAQITTLAIPSYVHGVSIDYNGNVWGVTLFEEFAYRVDPSSGVFDTFTGLTFPYTYSDMTGHGLSSVVAPN